ncbi:DUF6883 domain-containing protein [Psychrobacter sp. W2-37-MNA-CIBAN-0211]|uniref:two-partner secretion domain-containing protein n=1 Tax=Psychrobacter sp. W2-37-MNA-CIBAN-0211 TaxID=3140443 RepID=UPI00331CDC97
MNKQCYRVVFNKARGMMMVVSEITKSQNKTAGNGSSKKSVAAKSESPSSANLSYHRLALAILCCQSMIYTQVQAATSAIQNTASNVPAAQRAALLKATNGTPIVNIRTPIVNIRTPNSNGLSHNTYNQFDIGSNGAILNNSIGGANTQLAGAITGNQYLAQSAANTILNEVRSNAPAKFQGNLEVAGQRADVIIASPSGLQIQGGGFINANRATLTTGTPTIDSAGNLTGFDVKQGQIQFDKALDTVNALGGELYNGKNKNQSNYVDVLARAVIINGKIFANQEVSIVTGSNTVDYDTGEATKIAGTGTAPTLAVDVSTLGGIYANSINLVGTENGLGVRNAGRITAGQQIVLTNSGRIENSGSILTDVAQTSLLSINATGTTGSIEHSGTIGSYGMIDMQADKDILLNGGIIRKENPGTNTQLMPDVLRINAKGDIKLNAKSDVRNFTIDDKANIFINADQSTLVTEGSIVGSNGGVEIDSKIISSISSDAQIFSRYAPIKINSNNLTFINGGNLSSKGDIYIEEQQIGNDTGFHTTSIINSNIKASGNLIINSDNYTNISSGTIITAKNMTVDSKSSTQLEKTGAISINGDALIRSNGKVKVSDVRKDANQGSNFYVTKRLDIQADKTDIIDSNLQAGEGISAQSLRGNIDINGSRLTSNEGYIAAIAQKGDVTFGKIGGTNSETLIVAAANNVEISDQWLSGAQVNISSGNSTRINNATLSNQLKATSTGDMVISSQGNTDMNYATLNSGGNVMIDSKGRFSIIDTTVNASKNLKLSSDERIYSNTTSTVDKNGKESYNYDAGSKKNSFVAGEILALNSRSSQYLSNTDFTGSAISLDGWGHALAPNLNFTATGASKKVEEERNGDIQIVNKDSIYLNHTHSINANKDFIAQADRGIHINGTPKIIAQSIGLRTVTAKTNKSDKLIDNAFGDGDINISNTELMTNGKVGSGRLIIESANHLNIINSKTNSTDSTTLKSGNLMRLNNSDIRSGQHLTIDSNNQLITNGERYAKNSGTSEAPKWSNSWRHTAGDTILHADEIVSIDSRLAQSHQNTDIIGGAVIINSSNAVAFSNNTNVKAIGSTKLAKNTTKLSDGKIANTLNGDLVINSTAGDLTIDPNKVTLAAAGDATLAARGGQLYLKGYKGTQGLGSEKVVKLTASGDINLSGKEVVIEGSDLISKKGFSGSNVVLVDGKSVPTAGISITATDGSVELKAIKNSFSNYVSPYKINSINAEISNAKVELSQPFYDSKWLESYNKATKEWVDFIVSTCDNSPFPGGIGQCVQVRGNDMNVIAKYRPDYFEIKKSDKYEEYVSYLSQKKDLENLVTDLNQILITSKKASTGFEHKAVSLTGGKDINITAKQGVLIEGGDITSSTGGIIILAEGNLASVDVKDGDDKTVGVNYDSIRITGLADIYQQGDIDKEGKVAGSNYSYHQLINQPTLTSDKDIKILAQGGRPVNTASKVFIDNNAVNINSADIQSTSGDVRIDAARGDINLEAAQVAFMDGSQTTSTSRKWYGKKKTKTTTTTSLNSNAVTTDIVAKNIILNAESDIAVYGSELNAGTTGDIRLKAGREIKLYAIKNIDENAVDIKKKSSFLGVRYNKDHTNDTRQEITQLPTDLVASNFKSQSGGNTLLDGTIVNTANPAKIQVRIGQYAEADAKVILGVITNQIITTHNQEKENTVWMKTVDQGSVVTTASLPKFNQVPTITSPGGVTVAVPVDITVDANNKAKTNIQKSQEELGKIALNLSKQPGYEYLAALDKTNDINWAQVELIQKNWNYTQEGLTPGAAALIAIAITIAAGPAGSGLTASMIATNAAGIALQTQAVITLINNKGDISKTLKDMASSDTIRGMATAALTAGVGAKLGLGSSVTDSFGQKLANGVGTGLTQAVADAALNGASFEEALKNSLRGALVDVFAAETFGKFVKDFEGDDFASNLAHKLVAAGVGCATASAKKQDCNAGAIGAAVGEIMAEAITDEETKLLHKYGLLSPKEELRIENIATLTAGTIALLLNINVDTAASSATLAVKNNYNGKPLQDLELDEGFLKAYAALTGLVLRPVIGAEFYSKYNSATTNAQREKILVEAGLSMVVSKTLASKFTKVRACFVAGTLIETINGLRAIETIKKGDMVWSRHEDTLEYGYRPVVDTFSFDDKEIYEVVVRDNHGKLETYQTTKEHPFWVVDTGWLPASLLQTGMTLVNRDDQAVLTVISQTKLDKADTVYNFEVAEFHTYHIGNFGTWVHNACLPSLGSAIINMDKITGYALNSSHAVGGHKAKVFESALGYNKTNADDLVLKIRQGLKENPAVLKATDSYGKHYTVDMPIKGPNGKTTVVRTGWIIDTGKTTPRITTVFVK